MPVSSPPLLTCVDSHVVLVIGGAGEAPPAVGLWTHVGTLTRVRSDVNLEDVGGGKRAATARKQALEGSLTCIDRARWIRAAAGDALDTCTPPLLLSITLRRPPISPSWRLTASSNTDIFNPFCSADSESTAPGVTSTARLLLAEENLSSASLHPRYKRHDPKAEAVLHPGDPFDKELGSPLVLLTCVCPDVFLQISRSFEGFAAHVFWTLVWFLTSVCSHMALQPIPCPVTKLHSYFYEKEITLQALHHLSVHAHICPVSAKLKGKKYPKCLTTSLTTQFLLLTPLIINQLHNQQSPEQPPTLKFLLRRL